MDLTESQKTPIHQRLTLLLSLDALKPEESRFFQNDSESDSSFSKIEILEVILERGYYWALKEREFSLLFKDEAGFEFLNEKPDSVEEVFDILNMFQRQKEIHLEGRSIQFSGFDGNHDEHYLIQNFLIDILGRYRDVTPVALNSHCTILPTYRKLLDQQRRKSTQSDVA